MLSLFVQQDWTASWILQDNAQTFDGGLENTLPWLLPLLTDRSLDIRWCGWALSTALLNGSAGAESVVNEFQIYPGGVWASAVGVILDDHENSLIRSQVCFSCNCTNMQKSELQGNELFSFLKTLFFL